MVVRKLKAAIYECVLAHSLCNAVTSTGPCGTPFRRRADSVLAQFLRLLSLMRLDGCLSPPAIFGPVSQTRCISTASLRATAPAAC